ncbi:MAG: hypothetical protein JO131_09740 [Gammaproteobacteria bacterium]|nr:hypothetical protein [Gammaproteobacteria bacterium]
MLLRMSDKDKIEILAHDLENPLFFIYPIRKNRLYINLLIDVISHETKLINDIAHLLINHQWSSSYIDNAITQLNNSPKYQNTLPIKIIDIAYCALLLNKISKNVFYDCILHSVIKESFSKKKDITASSYLNQSSSHHPLLLAKNISWNNAVNDIYPLEENSYIKEVVLKAQDSTGFFFNQQVFIAELKKQNAAYYFTITLDAEEFISSIKNTDHFEWVQLFLSEKYPLLIYDLKDKELFIHVPSISLLHTFLKAVVKDNDETITPVMTYGIVSAQTSERLHKKGLHIISIQDKRFKSLSTLHGAKSNSFEVVMHDLLFHTIILSARSLRIRHLFWNSIVPLLKQYISYESSFLCDANPIVKKATEFFYAHLLETALDVSVNVPKNKVKTVTNSALYVFLHMLLGSIRQTYHYFFNEMTQDEMVSLVTQILSKLLFYLKDSAGRHIFISKVHKHFGELLLETPHPAKPILQNAWVKYISVANPPISL